MIKTLCIGEILWDIFPDKRVWGGAPANFIFHTSQFGADACAATALGHDVLGSELFKAVKKTGINLECTFLDRPTGVVDISVNESGAASYTFNSNCAWDFIPFTANLAKLSSEADLISFGTLAQRSNVSKETIFKCLRSRQPSAKVLFDVNLRKNFYTKEIIHNSLKESDFLKLNEEEEEVLLELFGKTLFEIKEEYNLELVILTLGADGSRIISNQGVAECASYPCTIVDTVGAGDSFTACFIINYLNGVDIATAQSTAAQVASYVCGNSGATIEIPEKLKLILT